MKFRNVGLPGSGTPLGKEKSRACFWLGNQGVERRGRLNKWNGRMCAGLVCLLIVLNHVFLRTRQKTFGLGKILVTSSWLSEESSASNEGEKTAAASVFVIDIILGFKYYQSSVDILLRISDTVLCFTLVDQKLLFCQGWNCGKSRIRRY
jgi:hypothetical protein